MWRSKLELEFDDGKAATVFLEESFRNRTDAKAYMNNEKKNNHWVKLKNPSSVKGSTYE